MSQGGGLWVVIAMIVTLRRSPACLARPIAALAKRECDRTMFALILAWTEGSDIHARVHTFVAQSLGLEGMDA